MYVITTIHIEHMGLTDDQTGENCAGAYDSSAIPETSVNILHITPLSSAAGNLEIINFFSGIDPSESAAV